MNIGTRLQWGVKIKNLKNCLNSCMFSRQEWLSSQRQFCRITYKIAWEMNERVCPSGFRAWLGYNAFMKVHRKSKAVSTPKRDFCAHDLIAYSTCAHCEGLGFHCVPPFSAQSGCAEWRPVCPWPAQCSWVKNRLCNCVDNLKQKLREKYQVKNKKAWRISSN